MPRRESQIWRDALRPDGEREHEPVFSPLGREEHALGLETIYEGYLVHYGRPRLFAPHDRDTALLLGDYLYAHGLARIAALGNDVAVAGPRGADLALRAGARRGRAGDGTVWAATALELGTGDLEEPRADYRETGDLDSFAALVRGADGALARHAERISYAR